LSKKNNLKTKLAIFFSNKKLLFQLTIVSLIFSFPILYLIYSSYSVFKETQAFTSQEITGLHEAKLILGEFDRLSLSADKLISEKFKNHFLNLEKINKDFYLSDNQMDELRIISKHFDAKAQDELTENYLVPLIRFIANNSKLILDPDIESYYLMDILVLRSPRIHALLLRNKQSISTESLLKSIQLELSEINYSIMQVLASNQSAGRYLPMLNTCFVDLNADINRQLTDVKTFNSTNISKKLNNCNEFTYDALLLTLNQKNNALFKKYLLTLELTLVIWILGTLVGFYFYFKVIEEQLDSTVKIFDQEKKILEAEKLSVLGELTSSIVHEIKNPLTLITFEAEYMQMQLNKSEHRDEATLKRLAKISQMANRIDKISNMVTIYSRNSQNDLFEKTEVQKLIEDSVYIINLKARNLNIDIEVIPSSYQIACRPYQIEQVIINLLNNAIDEISKFEEKWIKISSELVIIDGLEKLRINIIDSGKGINKEIQDKIFGSFYTTKAAGKGTGLGLSVSVKIVEAHNGRLYYDSQSPNTKFVIEIPLGLVS
jgi:signal transduction histidine kinase